MSAPLSGLAAYRALGAQAGAAPAVPSQPGQGGSFGAMLERAMEGAVQATRTADATSVQALTGQAGVTDVVLAVSRAELALQTTVALRDRVVSAYQEIMRMPI
ncbi:flagellar hook-basal body complex protein FliE [Teichococcus aestuarii]|uniref:flagellar hook-basal body complex protein FliE n=1 Tax=Teichococcus aestuarii TaxID=568898 RepID=UPI00360C2491